MIDLIRELLDRPLDPRHARVVLALATCLTVIFSGLVALGTIGGSRPTEHEARSLDHGQPTAPAAAAAEAPPSAPEAAEPPATPAGQDPQDRRQTGAFRRARRSIREHRVLQRLPYRRGAFSITLVGADDGHAIVRVEAGTKAAARRLWTLFLRRSDDPGTDYETRFLARSRSIPAVPAHGREGFRGGCREGSPGGFRGDHGEERRRPHRERHCGAGDSLKSLPQPKASH